MIETRTPRTSSAYGQEIEVFSDDLDRWETVQTELLDAGVGVPLDHRVSWLREMADGELSFLVARDEHDGSLSAAFPIQHTPTRSLPGHYRSRVTRLGYAAREPGLMAALRILSELLRRTPRLLALNVELFITDPARRWALANAAEHFGYDRTSAQRRYRYTAQLGLSPDEDALAGSFTGSCRRFIRDPRKKGYSVQPVRDDRWAPRMAQLWEETFSRTGAPAPPRDWLDHLAFARMHPDLYHIVGTFGPDCSKPDALKAFACAKNNGDHGVYADGASTRDVESGVALTYAPMWELIKWTKDRGCEWFDMGGISEGNQGDDEDPLGGISDFKRRFTEQVIEVGTEWVYRPLSLRTSVAETVSRSASMFRTLFHRAGL